MSETQYQSSAHISVDLIPEDIFGDIRYDALKQAHHAVSNQVAREVTRCLWEYIDRHELSPTKDIIMITDANGILYIDTKYQREILHTSFPLLKEAEDNLNLNLTISIILRKNYE